MFARFDENQAMTLQDIKETKCYGRTDGRTDNVKTEYPPQTKFAGGINMFARFHENQAMTLQDIKETKCYGGTDGQPENSISTTNKVCRGYNDVISMLSLHNQAEKSCF